MKIFTLKEICDVHFWKDDQGWFYGLVRDEGKIHLAEICPPFGYQPKIYDKYFILNLHLIIRDLLFWIRHNEIPESWKRTTPFKPPNFKDMVPVIDILKEVDR